MLSLNMYYRTSVHTDVSVLSLSFDLPVASIFTPVTNCYFVGEAY